MDNKACAEFDFTKAFDTVPHTELLVKLWKIGITGSLWQFLGYLSNRNHFVPFNIHISLLTSSLNNSTGKHCGSIASQVDVNNTPDTIYSTLSYALTIPKYQSKLGIGLIKKISRMELNHFYPGVPSGSCL